MLALSVVSASVARPPQAEQPPRPHALVAKETPHALLCVSTAVNLKTATCNSDCNNGRDCPEACFCLEHTYYMPPEEEDLALSMSDRGLERVTSQTPRALHAAHASSHLTALHRELGPADTLKACSSLSDTVDHAWCDKNCNAQPSNCPEATCKCDGTRPACVESGKSVSAYGVVPVPCCAGMQAVNGSCTTDFPRAEPSNPGAPAASAAAAGTAAASAAPAWRSKLSAANPAKLPEEDAVGCCTLNLTLPPKPQP